MKRKIAFLLFILIAISGIVFAGWLSNGAGGVKSVGITETRINLGSDWAYKVTIHNSATGDVIYAQVNVTAAEFAFNSTNVFSCPVIEAGGDMEFSNEHDRSWKIKTISLRSGTGTNDVYVRIQ